MSAELAVRAGKTSYEVAKNGVTVYNYNKSTDFKVLLKEIHT